MSKVLILILFVLMTSATSYADCWNDSLSRVEQDILVMRSGAAYQLLDDPRIIEFWLPFSEVTICDFAGYVDGQAMTYYEIRNADAVGVIRAVAAR